ncbi:MAG: SirB2 family protein [Gammaproteobacteria bacterium]|nr:SirB2 family protein [Gammaproteobacteria bacterium]
MPDWFTVLKSTHMIAVALTISGFVLRGFWMMRGSALLNTRLARTLPHINDTVLLVSALSTAAILGQYPFVDAWLTAKVLGLVAYILFGAVALTYGKTRQIRIFAFAAAVTSFAYVVSVAFTKNPLIL